MMVENSSYNDGAIESVAADPEVRRRLARSLTPAEMSPAAGEAMALQLASLAHKPSCNRETSPLDIAFIAVPPLTMDLLYARAKFCGPDGIYALGPSVPGSSSRQSTERTDDDLIDYRIDPEVRLTLLHGLQHVGADRKYTIKAIVTGRPRLADPHAMTRYDGGISIGYNISERHNNSKPLDRCLPIPDVITAALDFVIGIQHRSEQTWLDAPHVAPRDVAPVDPSLTEAFFEKVWETEISVSKASQRLLSQYEESLSIIPQMQAGGRQIPTKPYYIDTVQKVARATARLELSEIVSPEHVETAIRIIEQSLHNRCYHIESLDFWQQVEKPKQAFRTIDAACARLVDETFSAETAPVSLTSLQETAPMVGLDPDAVPGHLERLANELGLYRVHDGGKVRYDRLSLPNEFSTLR